MSEVASADGFPELSEPLGHGDPRIRCRLVFESHKSLIATGPEDSGQTIDIRPAFLLCAKWLDFDLELHVHGVRHATGDVAVNVIGVKVAGVEINAHPVAAAGLDDLKQAPGLGDDAAMILNAQKDAMFPGVFTNFLKRFDTERLGLFQ